MTRQFYSEHPPRAEYALTDKGRELGVVVGALAAWGSRHVHRETALVHAECGHPVEIKYFCPQCAGRVRSALSHPYRAPVPVVCVGNLVAGGAGKTPVALALSAWLLERNVPVHVVTRGYGGRLRGPVRVDPGRHDAGAVGDEALLHAMRTPCWVARDRAAGIRAAVAAGAGDSTIGSWTFSETCLPGAA